jgi:hypothetical protein
MIILTPTQANRVRGLTTLGHALAPVPLANGNFVLPDTVLTDPAHARFKTFLSSLPRVADETLRRGERQDPTDIHSPIINSDFEQDPVKRSAAAFKRDWVVGKLVTVDNPRAGIGKTLRSLLTIL